MLQTSAMQISEIPFVRRVGIGRGTDGKFELPAVEGVQNHLGTIHAAAQFALAETASGDHLQRRFPEYARKVVAILRGSKIKFKKPAQKQLSAVSSIPEATAKRFENQMSRKGHGLLAVDVELRDADGNVTAQATFDWYIQRVTP